MYTHADGIYTHIHARTHTRRQTRGWRVRKKGGAPTPAASLALSLLSLLALSLSPFLSLFFCEVGAHSLRFRTLFLPRSLFLSLSNSSLPPQLFSPPQPLASAFVGALSSSTLLFCEKGWLLERKRGPPERETETDGKGGLGYGSETDRRARGWRRHTTNGGGQDERWVQRTEPSQLQDN